MLPSTPTRRDVLRAGALLPLLAVVAGCTGDAPALPDPDLVAGGTALTREQELLARYDATLAAHPDLAGRLGPLRADHAAHAAALVSALPSPSPSASPSAATVPAVSPDPATAVRELVTAETAAASAAAAQATTAGGPLAALLTSVCGAEATHAAALTGALGAPA